MQLILKPRIVLMKREILKENTGSSIISFNLIMKLNLIRQSNKLFFFGQLGHLVEFLVNSYLGILVLLRTRRKVLKKQSTYKSRQISRHSKNDLFNTVICYHNFYK